MAGSLGEAPKEGPPPPAQPPQAEPLPAYSAQDGEVLGWVSMGFLILSGLVWMFRGGYDAADVPARGYQPLEVLALTLFWASVVLGAWSVLKAFSRN